MNTSDGISHPLQSALDAAGLFLVQDEDEDALRFRVSDIAFIGSEVPEMLDETRAVRVDCLGAVDSSLNRELLTPFPDRHRTPQQLIK